MPAWLSPAVDVEAVCDRIAADQHGVISRRQALAAGLPRGVLERRVSSGRWRPLHPGVYVPRPVPSSWHQELMAAVLRGGPEAYASHRSAAQLRSLDGIEDAVPEISVTSGRRMKGVIVHRRDPRDEPRIVLIEGIRASCVERTIIELAAVTSPFRLGLAVDDALRRRMTTISRLGFALEEPSSRGKAGLGGLRKVLEQRRDEDGLADSPLETLLLRLLRRHGLPPPVLQFRVLDGANVVARLDFAYPVLRLGIEADGFRWHGGRERWARDLRRENRLKLLGWTLLHFSKEDIHDRPETVISQIRAALAGHLSSFPTPHVGKVDGSSMQ